MAYTLLDMAVEILKDAPHPLSYREIWEQGKQRELVERTGVRGKTPWNTLQALLSVDARRLSQSKFCRVDDRPKRYFLKSRQHEINPAILDLTKLDESGLDKKSPTRKHSYMEKDLHPLLAHFAYANPDFAGDRRHVHTKTIAHAKSTRKELKEWLHPDMVGVHFPFEDMKKGVVKLSSLLDANSVFQLFSFELKKEITKRNYRECFFQSVSNSSWAHEGYLVAAEISDDDDLRRELGRLTNAFGIGVVHLNLENIYESEVLFDAKNRSGLDWETINKLCTVNADFQSFIDRLNIDCEAGQAHLSEYDEVIKDPPNYISQKLKIKVD